MISQSHHRLPPLSLSVGAAALLDVTTLEAATGLLADEELLVAELEALEDGVGVGEGDGVGEGGDGAVTSKFATPTVRDSWPTASSR